MLARLLHLHPKTHSRLVRLGKEAERDGAYRVAKRLQSVVLNSEGRTSGELAGILKAPRSRVSEWLSLYQTHGVEGLLEGYRSGRPPRATGPRSACRTTRPSCPPAPMWFGEHASPEQMPVVSGYKGAGRVKGHGQVAVREGRRWVEPPQEHEGVSEAR